MASAEPVAPLRGPLGLTDLMDDVLGVVATFLPLPDVLAMLASARVLRAPAVAEFVLARAAPRGLCAAEALGADGDAAGLLLLLRRHARGLRLARADFGRSTPGGRSPNAGGNNGAPERLRSAVSAGGWALDSVALALALPVLALAAGGAADARGGGGSNRADDPGADRAGSGGTAGDVTAAAPLAPSPPPVLARAPPASCLRFLSLAGLALSNLALRLLHAAPLNGLEELDVTGAFPLRRVAFVALRCVAWRCVARGRTSRSNL
jgi:hypothetical protein